MKTTRSASQSSNDSAVSSTTTWVVRPDPDLEDLIPAFLQNRRKETLDIQDAAGRGDFEYIARLAHTWKGICRPYGFVHLETLSRALEDASRQQRQDNVETVLVEIRDYLDNVRVVYEGSLS